MVDYSEFEQELHTALGRLYDPDYQPCEALCEGIGCDPAEGMPAIQTAILRAVESLEPTATTPPAAPARQVYDLLHRRFVQRLTQEEKVPFFGDLPGVGYMFRNKGTNRQKQELLIFVTPKILKETLNLRR